MQCKNVSKCIFILKTKSENFHSNFCTVQLTSNMETDPILAWIICEIEITSFVHDIKRKEVVSIFYLLANC